MIIGFLFLAVVGIWVLVDVFLVGKMVKEENEKLVEECYRKILAGRAATV